MKIPFSGGCSCGAIRYEFTAEPIMMLKCHCRDCQQVSGGGFAAAVLVPAEAFRLTRGQLRYHFTPSIRRGKHKRGFCPECGSRMTGAEFEGDDSQFVGILASDVSMIRVGFSRRWIFSFRTRNRGTKWIPAIAKFEQYPPIISERISNMQKITPFLWFDDQAEQAAKFYTLIFKNSKVGKITRYDEAAEKAAGRPAGSVMTIEFEIEGQKFTALNGGPGLNLTNRSRLS